MANLSYKIVNVDKNNVDVAGVFCQKSRRNEEGYQSKAAWVKERFEEGLRLKLLLVDEGPSGASSQRVSSSISPASLHGAGSVREGTW